MSCEAWPIVVNEDCCPEWNALPEAQKQRALKIATDVIWALSGRQYGICTACVRPCKPFCFSCGTGCSRPGQWGVRNIMGAYVNENGRWVNCGCGCGYGKCKSSCAVYLDPAPVTEILSVKINGAVAVGGFQVINGNLLVRSAEGGCLPECNDLSAPDTAPGTWSVTYKYGIKVPAVALEMAAIFACEIAKACAGQKCRISGRMTSISRDGVSITLDPKTFLDAGLTGLPEVDQWLRSMNPYGLASRSEVWSPDFQPLAQVTWPGATC